MGAQPAAGIVTVPGPAQQERRDAGPLTGKGRARKAELLDAARRVFERRGFLDTRVADIVGEARVAQGTFYTYFDSKDAVFQAVARAVVAELLEALQAAGPHAGTPYERAHAAMERFVDAYQPRARIIALIEQVGTFTPELKHLRLQVREAFVERAARGIAHQQESGVADRSLDPVLTAEVLGAMVDHTCYVWLNLGKEFDREALLRTLTLVWVRAIGAEEAGGTGRPGAADPVHATS
ncbi:TetR/AcrR family transcriptional regulator [Geodermatophilus marinus]|uniref:TetR/AcrR family transcriptional regulator n=1 Tax=Geodermatophilus sp. LHW52908 TaxID=2303986 RepID=UPI000E3BB18D|nr:TetR/AcrR family transcriptional regulator [Geodermatophilus sp. LHW52908]RFU21676.1 TetR/AcrR family transcriptional regulator [Geodermatophilus sp. LHW52908]